jgi:hypothetical protein
MRRLLFMLVILAAVLSVCSCSLLKKFHPFARKHPPASAEKKSDRFIGVVESVNPEQKFVLVRTELRLAVAPGAKLEAHSASGSKSSLVVTPERKMNFLSADITSGSPAAGDVVTLPAGSAALPPAPASTTTGAGAAGVSAGAAASQDHSAPAPEMRPPAASEPALPVQTR